MPRKREKKVENTVKPLQLEKTLHPGEEHLLSVFALDPETDKGIQALRAAGVPWPTIISWVVKYGPLFRKVTDDILGALVTNPPTVAALLPSAAPRSHSEPAKGHTEPVKHPDPHKASQSNR